jgi:probable phosphoglycerate mutase
MRPVKPDLWLVRHGQTEWSETGRHTSRTDVALTEEGRASARRLATVLGGHDFALVLVSPATRALDTARLAGFPSAELDPDLRERGYGELEGLTTAEVRARGPEWARWSVWTGSIPGGEPLEEAAARAARVITRADAAGGDVLLFGHGHQLRILTAVALELDPGVAARLILSPATVSVIGSEHDLRALASWNRR